VYSNGTLYNSVQFAVQFSSRDADETSDTCAICVPTCYVHSMLRALTHCVAFLLAVRRTLRDRLCSSTAADKRDFHVCPPTVLL